MKWEQTKKMLDSDGVKEKDRKNLFKEYEYEADLEKELRDKTKFEEWVTYPNDQFNQPFDLDRKAQRKYEVLCGGFLLYHDVVFKKYGEEVFKKYGELGGYEYPDPEGPGRDAKWKKYPEEYKGLDGKKYFSKDFEHNIYFEWFPKKGHENNKTSVIIHITPTPDVLNSTPPKPPPPPPPES
jgi:hypothetical protein